MRAIVLFEYVFSHKWFSLALDIMILKIKMHIGTLFNPNAHRYIV